MRKKPPRFFPILVPNGWKVWDREENKVVAFYSGAVAGKSDAENHAKRLEENVS